MSFFAKLLHPGRARRGAEIARIYLKHGITELDVERVIAEMDRAAKDPTFEPRYNEWIRIGQAQQRVQMELQEKGFVDALPPSVRLGELLIRSK